MVEFNVWAAIRTLKGHLGTGVGFRIAQGINEFLTEEEWESAMVEARAILRNRANEMSRSLSRRPIAEEILPFKVTNPGGYLQQVEVYVKDRETGLIDERHFSYKTDTLRSRVSVVKEVWNMFLQTIAEKPDEYPEEVVGVAYVGTYQLTPRK